MVDHLFDNLSEQAKNFSAPVEKFNNIILKNMEKVAEIQVETIKAITEMGAQQIKEFSEIRNFENLKDFGVGNVNRLVELNKKLVEDARTVGEIGINFKHDVEQLMAELKGAFEDTQETTEQAEPTQTEPAKAAEPAEKAKKAS